MGQKPEARSKGSIPVPGSLPRTNMCHGASHVRRLPAYGELPPNNQQIDSPTIRKVQATAKLVGLAQAIGLQSISKAGYYKAVARMKATGHATPPRSSKRRGPSRIFEAGTEKFGKAYEFLAHKNRQMSYEDAGPTLGASATTLARSFGNASADPAGAKAKAKAKACREGGKSSACKGEKKS